MRGLVVEPAPPSAELDGTFYLDNHWVDAASGNISLNSASNYRNGIVNEDIFNGTAIDGNATYRIEGDFYASTEAQRLMRTQPSTSRSAQEQAAPQRTP